MNTDIQSTIKNLEIWLTTGSVPPEAQDDIRTLISAVREREWRGIESAPRDGTSILACIPRFRPSQVQWLCHDDKCGWARDPEDYPDEDSFATEFHSSDYCPTAWMPLPEGPTQSPS